MNVKEVSLLSILIREDEALKEMKFAGELLMDERNWQSKADPSLKIYYEEVCQRYAERRDKALAELNEARKDIREYFRYHSIVPMGGEF